MQAKYVALSKPYEHYDLIPTRLTATQKTKCGIYDIPPTHKISPAERCMIYDSPPPQQTTTNTNNTHSIYDTPPKRHTLPSSQYGLPRKQNNDERPPVDRQSKPRTDGMIYDTPPTPRRVLPTQDVSPKTMQDYNSTLKYTDLSKYDGIANHRATVSTSQSADCELYDVPKNGRMNEKSVKDVTSGSSLHRRSLPGSPRKLGQPLYSQPKSPHELLPANSRTKIGTSPRLERRVHSGVITDVNPNSVPSSSTSNLKTMRGMTRSVDTINQNKTLSVSSQCYILDDD